MVRPLPEGGLGLHYDPAIAVPFRAIDAQAAAAGEAALWQLYDHIDARTLLLRGAQSDLLSPETAQAMRQRGPQARLGWAMPLRWLRQTRSMPWCRFFWTRTTRALHEKPFCATGGRKPRSARHRSGA